MRGTEDIPVLLSAKDIQNIGFSRSMVYDLMSRADFPVIRIGSRKFVRSDKFFSWLEEQETNKEEK